MSHDDITALAEATGVLRDMREEPSNPMKGVIVGMAISLVIWTDLFLAALGLLAVLRWLGAL